ncbi:MAG: response regulator [Candidatus Brocadiales bacterium]|nr:response regulator [Candidatus Brocadiales bacterium]
MARARILIIEDERQTVDELRDHLELHGFETEVALSGPVGTSVVEERKMDLAIIGTKVQDMEGLELLRRLKGLDPGLKAIIITDQKSKRYHASLVKAGAEGVISLPVNKDGALELIEEILKKPKKPPAKKKRFHRARRH